MQHRALTKRAGAVGLLAVILVTALALIFSLTISVQVLLNVRNAKLTSDFNSLYYAAEGGMREARMQLKKEDTTTKDFLNITSGTLTVSRAAIFGPASTMVTATGTAGSITRILQSTCQSTMDACVLQERAP